MLATVFVAAEAGGANAKEEAGGVVRGSCDSDATASFVCLLRAE